MSSAAHSSLASEALDQKVFSPAAGLAATTSQHLFDEAQIPRDDLLGTRLQFGNTEGPKRDTPHPKLREEREVLANALGGGDQGFLHRGTRIESEQQLTRMEHMRLILARG